MSPYLGHACLFGIAVKTCFRYFWWVRDTQFPFLPSWSHHYSDIYKYCEVTTLQYALPIGNGESHMTEILSCPDIVRYMNDIATAEHLLNQLKVQTPLLLTPTRLWQSNFHGPAAPLIWKWWISDSGRGKNIESSNIPS